MTYLSSGGAALLLGTTGPGHVDLARRGKVRPEPQIVAGRRLWLAEHLLQAANKPGITDQAITTAIEQLEPAGDTYSKHLACAGVSHE